MTSPLPPGTIPPLTKEELLACPFCGGEASPNGVAHYSKNHEAWWPDGARVRTAFFVNCTACGVSNQTLVGGYETRGKAIEAWNRRLVSPEGSDTPMQPLHVAPDGMLRFRVNPIVRFLLDNNGRGEYAGKRIDMNELACVDATDDEFAQFAELIGYSLGGYSELSYVTDERYAKAEAQKAALSQGNAALSDQEERDQ